MTHWFGESWGAPVCDPEDHIPVPVGESCARCQEPILAHDQGVSAWAAKLIHYHLDCYLKGILPHGADCPRCRGLERGQHKKHCAYRTRGEECSCVEGVLAP